jgi:hypothetical protein
MSTVRARDGRYEVADTSYWHLNDRNGSLLHNARLGEGITATISALAASPGMEGVVTPYSLLRKDAEKEQVFEAIRQQHFPSHPSRNKALFAFESKAAAERGLREWFPGESRRIVEVRLVAGLSRSHRADARWLDRGPADWDESARRYWAGALTPDPRLEVVIDGAVYLPEWTTFPLWGGGRPC